jgi:hypothetical protein
MLHEVLVQDEALLERPDDMGTLSLIVETARAAARERISDCLVGRLAPSVGGALDSRDG